jgi:hypothetical protein
VKGVGWRRCGPAKGSPEHTLNQALWVAAKTGDEAAVREREGEGERERDRERASEIDR